MLFVSLIVCLPAWQYAVSSPFDNFSDDPDLGTFTYEKWKEGKVNIPAYPDNKGLLKVELDRVDSPFTYLVDPRTLTAGTDGVVRYVVVIRSDSGSANVIYEGIRCLTREYRAYAYGTTDGNMSKALISEWKNFRQDDNIAHRYAFYKYYMCSDIQVPFKPEVMIQRIRYPDDFATGGDRED